MIDSTTLASQTKVKLAGASRRCVLVPLSDSAAIASQTPAQAPQTHNVRKCPVLSGPTDVPEENGASPDIQTTCAQNPYHPDRTLTLHQPAQPSQPQTPASASQTHNVRKCPVLSGPNDLPEENGASTDIKTTCAKNPSRPDRTLTRHQPAPPPQLQPQTGHSLYGPARCDDASPGSELPAQRSVGLWILLAWGVPVFFQKCT